MNYRYIKLLFLFLLLLPSLSEAKVLAGLVDQQGNPVHTRDEFILHVNTTVSLDPYGYKYTYDLTSDGLSNQAVWMFDIYLNDYSSIIQGSSNSPWGQAAEPYALAKEELWAKGIRWNSDPSQINPPPLAPGTTLFGFTFLSPHPPGVIKYYAEGHSEYPWFPAGMAPADPVGFNNNSPYGPGKVRPIIGPVKPATPNVKDNYSVIGCAGGICDVQLGITGPQDPYGNVYTYQWTGAFGSALGAKPVVQLAAGNYTVSVSVSDPYATLVTATMPITVVDPNPLVVVPPVGGNNGGQGGGTTGGGTNGGNNGNGQGTGGNANPNGDIDHDGIPDNEDDDRDGDGKSNDQDDDPDHAD